MGKTRVQTGGNRVMAAITFTEIMNCYPDNKMVYKHIKRDCGKLIPFVGAGLSVPCYPLWPKALKELAERVAIFHRAVENFT